MEVVLYVLNKTEDLAGRYTRCRKLTYISFHAEWKVVGFRFSKKATQQDGIQPSYVALFLMHLYALHYCCTRLPLLLWVSIAHAIEVKLQPKHLEWGTSLILQIPYLPYELWDCALCSMYKEHWGWSQRLVTSSQASPSSSFSLIQKYFLQHFSPSSGVCCTIPLQCFVVHLLLWTEWAINLLVDIPCLRVGTVELHPGIQFQCIWITSDRHVATT